MERHHQTLCDDLLKPCSKRKLEIKILHLSTYKVYKILLALEHEKNQMIFLAREIHIPFLRSYSVTLGQPIGR